MSRTSAALLLLPLPAGAAGPPPVPPVSVRLTFSAAEYDPQQPSKAVLECVGRNDGKATVEVPVGYDSDRVVLHSGRPASPPAPRRTPRRGWCSRSRG
jgi:hypothetical protein